MSEEVRRSAVQMVRTSGKEVHRISAGYQLGTAAAAGDTEALAALATLLHDDKHRARRAAMYGIASAGDGAVETLLGTIRAVPAATNGGGSLNVAVAAVFALGEACVTPTIEAVAALGGVLAAWRAVMADYCTAVVADAALAEAGTQVAAPDEGVIFLWPLYRSDDNHDIRIPMEKKRHAGNDSFAN
jgi:hypothetical protein